MKALKDKNWFLIIVIIFVLLPILFFSFYSLKESEYYKKHNEQIYCSDAIVQDTIKNSDSTKISKISSVQNKDSSQKFDNNRIISIEESRKVHKNILLPILAVLVILGIFIFFSEGGGVKGFKLWLMKMVYPIIYGAIIGLFLIILYLYITINTHNYDISSQYSSILGIYIGSIGFCVTAYGLFVHRSVILDINTFMDYLIDDLNSVKHTLFWCYPGLSFGSISARGSRYELFCDQLCNVFLKKDINKIFYIFDKNNIKDFYDPYMMLAKDPNRKDIKESSVTDAIKDSKNFIEAIDEAIKYINSLKNQMKNKQKNSNNTNNIAYNVPEGLIKRFEKIKQKQKLYKDTKEYIDNFLLDYTPTDFRFFVIIVDNIVNILIPFGLPQKFTKKFEFTYDVKGEHPVDFLVLRFLNKVSAKTLINQIEVELKKRNEPNRNQG